MRLLLLVSLLSGATAWAENLEAEIVALELGRTWDADLFARAVASKEPRVRRAAARAAGRIKDPRGVGPLLRLMHDEVGPVRRTAIFALGQIGGSDLLVPLRDAAGKARGADLPHVLEALGKTRDPRAVPTLVGFLREYPPAVRGEAALALFRVGDGSALPELFVALTTERDAEARWRMIYAAYSLLRSKARKAKTPVDVDPAPFTASLTSGATFQERAFAALALGSVKGGRDVLKGQLDNTDPRIVIAVARALSRWTDEPTFEAVRALADAPDELIRETAVRYFIAAIGKDDKDVKDRAGTILLELAVKLKSPHLRLLAREGAARVRKDAAVPVDGSADEEMVWRVNSWTPARLPTTLPKTTRGQVAAAEVCGEERVPRDVARRTLVELLTIKDFTVRATAIVSLAKRDAKSRVRFIVAAAKDSPGTVDADVRLEAANALGKLGVYHEWLKEAARDPDHPVRKAARDALAKLGRPLPPAPPAAGFSLAGLDAAKILDEASALFGARVTLKTNRGDIVMVLHPDEAPAHCVNFARLVKQGFYDNRTWHRVVADFVIQGGCPRGDGWGGPGYFLPDEIGMRPYVRGTVGMPKAGDDTGGCQIFVTHLPTPHLDGRYTVYAQVIEGLAVVDRIRIGDRIEKATLHRSLR